MAGMLAFGAMAGVGDEYVKQSGEERENKFQEIRDRRLAELQKEGRIHSSELATTENMRQETVSAAGAEIKAKADLASGEADRKNQLDIAGLEPDFTLGRGDKRFDSAGKEIATGTEWTSTTAASDATKKWMAEQVFSMNDAKTPTTRGDLNDEWYRLAYEEVSDPDFPESGIKIKRRKPDTQDWVPWFNSQVQPEFRLKPNDPLHMVGDPQALFNYGMSTNAGKAPGARQGFIDALKNEYKWWKGPEDDKNPFTASDNSKTPDPRKPFGQPGSLEPGMLIGGLEQPAYNQRSKEKLETPAYGSSKTGDGKTMKDAVNKEVDTTKGASADSIEKKIRDADTKINNISKTLRKGGLSGSGKSIKEKEYNEARESLLLLLKDLEELKGREEMQKRRVAGERHEKSKSGLKDFFGQQ